MEANAHSSGRGAGGAPRVPLDGLLEDFDALLAGPAGARSGPGGERRDHAALVALLDRLAAARSACPSAAHPSGPLPPRDDTGRRERLTARFPGLGLYATVEPVLEGAPEEPTVGDAIDDLVDLWAELERVAWYLVHSGPEDAARYFAWSHDVHWGRHLRELQLYLHALGE